MQTVSKQLTHTFALQNYTLLKDNHEANAL